MMQFRFFGLALFLFSAAALGAVIDDDVDITANFVRVGIHPKEGGTVHTFGLVANPGDLAGEDGLLNEGFGVGSQYVPNRRLNEKLEAVETVADRPVLRYTYDCDGPNISGLSVTRTMEPMPNESSMKVTWTVENKGTERQWVAPWLYNDITPGGAVNAEDRLDIPSLGGIEQADGTRFYMATRNWIAATDPLLKESVYWVFDAEDTHSYMAGWDKVEAERKVKTWFVPQLMQPGMKWSTTYCMNVVRGLARVDFATDQLAAQVDYADGKLVILLAAVKEIPDLQIQGRILAQNDRVWTMPDKKFTLGPNRVIRCSYDWKPEGEGSYEFLAQVTQNGKQYYLGKDTSSPHGGIDTRFNVGKAGAEKFEAWTNAPYALERGVRTLERKPVANGPVAIWVEPSLNKIFENDIVELSGAPDPTVRIALARGEYESVQIGIRPPEGINWIGVTAQVSDLTAQSGSGRIAASDISLNRVEYHNIIVPSHYEGPTGRWPDALPPLEGSFTAQGGQCTPLWVTVRADRDLPGGNYTGTLTLSSSSGDSVTLALAVKVFDFELPPHPSMKTDFGFWMEAAQRGSKQQGGGAGEDVLANAYRDNAFAHRVTLRDLCEIPEAQSNYSGALAKFKKSLDIWKQKGLTSVSVPAELLDQPAQLAEANAFVKQQGLENFAFTHLAHEPQQPAWEQLLVTMEQWKSHAPDISIRISTAGLRPFLPEALPQWLVHAQMMDTAYNSEILNKVAAGGEVWWYINQTPPRPYGNFFIDFQAIEHRILFWQAWALGVKGMNYWSVNYAPEDANPWETALDAAPTNGNGMLVYPGAKGPVNSIRWENIRDGLEDYDYLTLFTTLQVALKKQGGNTALLERAAKVNNLEAVIPNLVEFTRDPAVLLNKRVEIAAMIEEMQKVLKK